MRKIRLTESDIRNVISRTVKRMINEGRGKDDMLRGVYAARYLMNALGLQDFQAAAWAGVSVDENGCTPNKVCKAEKNNQGSQGTRNGMYGAGIGSSTGASKEKLEKQMGKKFEDATMDDQLNILADKYRRKPYYKYWKQSRNLQEATAVAIFMFHGGKVSNTQMFRWERMPSWNMAVSALNWAGQANANRFTNGVMSSYHKNAAQRRLQYAQEILNLIRRGVKGSPV
jgi:hypothetical protein